MNLEFKTRVIQSNMNGCVVNIELNRVVIATYELAPNFREAEAEYEAGIKFAKDLAVHIWRLREEEDSY
jgi:hypothetical protein